MQTLPRPPPLTQKRAPSFFFTVSLLGRERVGMMSVSEEETDNVFLPLTLYRHITSVAG